MVAGAIYIDTREDFLRTWPLLEPVYITSKTRGKVLVPCARTLLVRSELVVANTWNPNSVPEDKLLLLLFSVVTYGFCFPVVAIFDEETGRFVIIDGFHRRLISGEDWLDFDYVPVAVLSISMAERMAATWAFNKARGHHQVDLDAELIRKLVGQGLTDEDIAQRLGVDLDTVFRYKQVAGIAEAVGARATWSMAWEMREEPDAAPPSDPRDA